MLNIYISIYFPQVALSAYSWMKVEGMASLCSRIKNPMICIRHYKCRIASYYDFCILNRIASATKLLSDTFASIANKAAF